VKVVVDSLVLIAASISRAGVCAQLLEEALTHHELVISDFIVEQVSRKLRARFDFPESDVRELRRLLRRIATTVAPLDLARNVCRDSSAIAILGTAAAAGAAVLVTVDQDLLVLGSFEGIAIIKPGEFWRLTTG
jgi:putative PIN family toxin of toxin-antitoxin system